MSEPKTLLRTERIKMFFNEYYFGQSFFIQAMRIFGGPLLIVMGIRLYQYSEKFSIAYGGFCVFYGVYLILKPLIWILSRLDSFKTVEISIDISTDRLKIKDQFSESEVLYGAFTKIFKRKFYYALQLSNATKIYLPFELLTSEQKSNLDNNLK